jgi:hypothetical protein
MLVLLSRFMPMPAEQIVSAVRQSQEAYWRELPDLLRSVATAQQWVAYAGDKRIGVGATQAELVCECLRRGLSVDEIYVARIRPRALPPWEAEQVVIPSLELSDTAVEIE